MTKFTLELQKSLSQQPEALLKKELLHLGFIKNFKELWKAINRGVFRTQPNIKDGAFCENSWRLNTAHCFCKKLHHGCSTGFWIRPVWLGSEHSPDWNISYITSVYVNLLTTWIKIALPKKINFTKVAGSNWNNLKLIKKDM